MLVHECQFIRRWTLSLYVLPFVSMSFVNSIRVKMQFSKRVREAAMQMYAHVQRGASFEIPSAASKDDLTVRAVMCLRQMYPEVPVVYQARGIIIGHVDKTMKVSDAAWGMMKKGRYMPEAGLAQSPEAFLNDQAAFLAGQGLDFGEEVKEGQRRQAERDRIVLAGGSAVEAERTAVPVPAKETPTAEKLVEQMLKATEPAESK